MEVSKNKERIWVEKDKAYELKDSVGEGEESEPEGFKAAAVLEGETMGNL